jgi:hypothetical protein
MSGGVAATARGGLPRRVEPELLDVLPVDDPRAMRSRRDLRRVNRVMGNWSIVRRALDRLVDGSAPLHLAELGAGDGSLMLHLARHRRRQWRPAHVTLIDRQPCVSAATLAAIRAMGWTVEVAAADVFDWLAHSDAPARPFVVANLFMHHFGPPDLPRLMQAIAGRARAFVCCEPRRSRTALAGSHLLGALGCNAITRHDAVVSVHAGFSGQELTAAWTTAWRSEGPWQLDEGAAGLFSHRFTAIRRPP